MKKYITIMILFLMLFAPLFSINAKDVIEAQSIPKRIYEEVENGAINESSSFANIVIFIKFADETSYNAPYDYDYYEDLFNSTTSASLKSYYLEVSYQQLTIDSYIVNDGTTMIYYQDTQDRDYFEEYDETTNPNGYDGSTGNTQSDREHALLKRAIDYVDDNNLVSSSLDLDVNDDGDIDSITFMVSGEDNGWNTLLWPHKWNLSTYYNYSAGEYYNYAPTINGKYAYTYTFELLGNSTNYDVKVDVGVLSHETFHLISAPDLYHYYRYFNIEPVGNWGLMDGTTTISSHMLGYMKEQYGNWIDSVDEITESGTYTLAPMADSADNLYRIDLGYSNEFIYLEYRVQEGMFETYIPESGLLAYRVDFDYFNEGNEDGYYSTTGVPKDELFIFRPGIDVTTLPLVFPEIDDTNVDEDGDIDNAAISNNNSYSEMGNDTDIAMFYSDGTLIDIKIYNVLEHDGVITFDVYLPPRIELISEVDIPEGTDLYLYDGPGFEYRLNISNIPSNALVYYTQDGSVPDNNSTLYDGGIITFDETTSTIKAAVYIDGFLTSNLIKSFNFVSDIETAHNPYGDMHNVTWYLDLEDDSSTYELHFYSSSRLETDYDYVYITDSSETLSYTGVAMANEDLSYNEDIIIQFTSDEYDDDYYGFYIEVDLLIDIQLSLVGEASINVEVFDTYTDQGALLSGADAHEYTLETVGVVNTSVLDEYLITYNVLDEGLNIVKTISRTVNVVDTTAPVVTINGEDEIDIEVFSVYSDEGSLYSDNLDTTLTYDVLNSVDSDVVGTYEVEYSVTDLSGNITTVTRTVNVVDTVDPTASLMAGIDTVYVGEEHTLSSIDCSDNYYDTCTVTVNGSVDTSTVGTYIIEYTATEGSGNSVTIYRYVNVIENKIETMVNFTIGKSLSTVKLRGEYTPGSCTVTITGSSASPSCEIDLSSVDTSTEGTYQIIYSVDYLGVTYEKVSYVFVYDDSNALIWYYDKSRRGYLWKS